MKITTLITSLLFSVVMNAQEKIRYVALGDSYTIGTGVAKEESWPELLTDHLKKNKINIELVANPARSGWTTSNLLLHEIPVFDKADADFVTILIGVNDWVQGVTEEDFKKNFVSILDIVQDKLERKNNIIVISIPDFGVTPGGARFTKGRDASEGIAAFNRIIAAEASKRNLPLVDLFEVSKQMGKDKDLVAPDGLHPSAKEHKIWESLIYPAAFELLK